MQRAESSPPIDRRRQAPGIDTVLSLMTLHKVLPSELHLSPPITRLKRGMETVGAVAASLELVKFSGTIINKIKQVRDAPKVIKDICSELELKQQLLKSAEALADSNLTLGTDLGRFEELLPRLSVFNLCRLIRLSLGG